MRAHHRLGIALGYLDEVQRSADPYISAEDQVELKEICDQLETMRKTALEREYDDLRAAGVLL